MQKQQQTLSAVAVNAKIVGTTMHIVNSTGSHVQTFLAHRRSYYQTPNMNEKPRFQHFKKGFS